MRAGCDRGRIRCFKGEARVFRLKIHGINVGKVTVFPLLLALLIALGTAGTS
jgi:hypothetical protein